MKRNTLGEPRLEFEFQNYPLVAVSLKFVRVESAVPETGK